MVVIDVGTDCTGVLVAALAASTLSATLLAEREEPPSADKIGMLARERAKRGDGAGSPGLDGVDNAMTVGRNRTPLIR
eukprot:2468655-Pleurochrysis_carterae.AAC.1